jgi:hypothetical protein
MIAADRRRKSLANSFDTSRVNPRSLNIRHSFKKANVGAVVPALVTEDSDLTSPCSNTDLSRSYFIKHVFEMRTPTAAAARTLSSKPDSSRPSSISRIDVADVEGSGSDYTDSIKAAAGLYTSASNSTLDEVAWTEDRDRIKKRRQ